MSNGQRFTFLGIAAVIAVAALVLLSGGSDDDAADGDRAAATATATATPAETAAPQEASPQETPEPTPKPTPEPPPLLRAGDVAELEFTEGDRVRFRVRSQDGDEIHVHGYDIEREVPAGETVTVAFPADITGIFEIEFHGSGEEIAELRVDPS
jgi:hypothetical protein